MGSEHFWKLSQAKFAPRCGARAIWKSKSLKHPGFGALLEVQTAFCVAGAGILAGAGVREGCKNVDRRGGFEAGPKGCLSRGRCRDFVLCTVDV